MIKVLFSTVFLLALCSARLTIPRSETLLKTDDENSADSSSFKTLNLTVYSAENAFYWPVSINSNPFNVLLQTARDKTFIPSGPNCIGCPGFPSGYKCYNYRTCDISDLNATVDYPLGVFSGYPGHETIALTQDIKVRSEILWGTSAQSRYDENFWFYHWIQGNLGLGSDQSQQNFIDILYEQNYIWENVFSFSVQPATRWDDSYQTNITNNSYLSIGFIPEDKVNKLTWISLKPDSKYSWALPISNVKIGSKVIDTSSEKYGSEISIDSGTKGLLLSPTIFKELSSKLESLKTTNRFQENSPAFYICNDNYLDDYPNITLRVGNTDIVLNVFTYLDFAGASTKRLSSDDDRVYCQLAVRESKSGGQVLGNTFLLNNHVVFSKLNQTVGIYQEYKPIFFGIHQTFIRKYWLYMLGAAVLLVTLIMVHRKRKADQLRKELDDYSNDPSMAINN